MLDGIRRRALWRLLSVLKGSQVTLHDKDQRRGGDASGTYNGKKYKVKMDDKTADALTDSVEPKVESQDITDIKKLAGIGETTTDQTMSAEITALKKLAGI